MSTSKAVIEEAQGLLKEIREKCARAFQETKRLETEARSVDQRRENLEREVHVASAECASLEEDCKQQEAYLAEFPARIQTATVKSEEVLQRWSALDRDVSSAAETIKQVEELNQSRLDAAHSTLDMVKQKLHRLQVCKVQTFASLKQTLDAALERKSALEFQFANEKQTLACSEKVASEAQAFLEEKRAAVQRAAEELDRTKSLEIVLPLPQQEELHTLYMANETRELALQRLDHANQQEWRDVHATLMGLESAASKLEEEIAQCEAQVEKKKTARGAQLALYAAEEERMENELAGLEREHELLDKLQVLAAEEVEAKTRQVHLDEQAQIDQEVALLQREMVELEAQLAAAAAEMRRLDAEEMEMKRKYEQRKREAEIAKLKKQQEEEEEAKRVQEQQRAELDAQLKREEQARAAAAAAAELAAEQLRKAREEEEALAAKRAEEEEALAAKRAEEEEALAAKRAEEEQQAAAEAAAAAAVLAQAKRSKQTMQRAAPITVHHQEISFSSADKENAPPVAAARGKRKSAVSKQVLQTTTTMTRSYTRASATIATTTTTTALGEKPASKPLPVAKPKKKAASKPTQPAPQPVIPRMQSLTPEWVRKQSMGFYESSPEKAVQHPTSNNSSEEEEDEKVVTVTVRKPQPIVAAYSRRRSASIAAPPMNKNNYQAEVDSSSSNSQFDLFRED